MNKLFLTSVAMFFLYVFIPVEYNAFAEQQTSKIDSVIVLSNSTDSFKGYEILETMELGEKLVTTIRVPEYETVEVVMEELRLRNGVYHVEPNYISKQMYTPNDPLVVNQWHHKTIRTSAAWERTKGADHVVVAVIDDGLDMSHSDLQGRMVAPYDVIAQSTTTIPQGEHGTHVAGIIASSMDNSIGGVGVAPQTKIMPINVFNGDTAYTSDIIRALEYAVKNGADIINMSLGQPQYSYVFDLAIQNAYKAGVLLVAASGNETSTTVQYPAAFPQVISVSATSENDSIAYYSNYGPSIDISAPGSNVWSTVPGSKYSTMSGTSMAAPVVSGAAALILGEMPFLTNDQVKTQLFQSTDDLGVAGKDIYYGSGRVNTEKAVAKIYSPVPGWKQHEEKTYYLKQDGTLAKGWLLNSGKWYYFNEQGIMQTGWRWVNNYWYYLTSNGSMQTGWLKYGGAWYFLNANGDMQTGWLYDGGKWYYLNPSGDMQTGWLKEGGKWYFLNSSGDMQTGWLYDGGKWYFLNPSGDMRTSWLYDGGKWYYLNPSGDMQTGWLSESGYWYYLKPSGEMVTGWYQIDGVHYYFLSSGVRAK